MMMIRKWAQWALCFNFIIMCLIILDPLSIFDAKSCVWLRRRIYNPVYMCIWICMSIFVLFLFRLSYGFFLFVVDYMWWIQYMSQYLIIFYRILWCVQSTFDTSAFWPYALYIYVCDRVFLCACYGTHSFHLL